MYRRRGLAMGSVYRKIDQSADRVSGCGREHRILYGWFILDRRLSGRDTARLYHFRLPTSVRSHASGRERNDGALPRWWAARHWRRQWRGARLESCVSPVTNMSLRGGCSARRSNLQIIRYYLSIGEIRFEGDCSLHCTERRAMPAYALENHSGYSTSVLATTFVWFSQERRQIPGMS